MDSQFQILDGHESDVNWVDFNGRRKLASCSNDRTVLLWKADDKEGSEFELCNISPLNGHAYGVNCVRYSPFGTIIASASTDGYIILWNSQTGEQVVKLMHESQSGIRVCCFSPSSALLTSGSDDETLVVWDISTRKQIKTLTKHEAKITGCSFTPDSAYLVSCSTAGDLKFWETKFGVVKYVFTHDLAHDLGVLGCDFSSQYEVNVSDGPLQSFYLLATCGNDDLVKLWHVRAGLNCNITLSHTLVGHTGNVNHCQFSQDGTLLASAGGDKLVIVWNPRSGDMIHKLEGHKSYVTCASFSEDNQYLASGSNDKTIIVWHLLAIKEKNINIESSHTEHSKPKNEMVVQLNSNRLKKAVDKWANDDVIEWLNILGLSRYANIFKTNLIDGAELVYLTNDSLLVNLQIEPLGHRNKILRGILALKNPLWQQLLVEDHHNTRKPGEFCCPITHEIMTDPVIAADGHTYEREAIEKWIYDGNSTSPMTNEVLINQTLTQNLNLRSLIQKFQSTFGEK